MPSFVETLAPYVPALIARRLARDPSILTAPALERFPAAVLFADISGFTPLAERLAKRGPAGAEELSRLLTTYFGELIDVIHAHGGDIVKFAGDALVAVWRVSDTEYAKDVDRAMRDTVLLAAQCALTAQEKLVEYQILEESPLALRVGIGVGELVTAHVGGTRDRWEFMLYGEPMLQASSAEHEAKPGNVVLSPEAHKLIADACNGSMLEDGRCWLQSLSAPRAASALDALYVPQLPSDSEKALRAYIPGAILSRLSAGQTSWLAELRRVSVLFINLPDLNHAASLEQAQTIMSTLQSAIYRYEGSINKLNVDDKGVMLIAALGLPPLSHEDDSSRAVRAALDMQAQLQLIGMRSSIGVTSGLVFCGAVGSEKRREYTMIGDVVNLSARLMQAAGGDILCDATTYQESENEIVYESLDPISVKGKSEPVAVYRPRAPKRNMVRSQSPMVGRVKERALFTDEIQKLHDGGQGGVIVIEGDTGIGKSRLLEEAMSQAQSLGMTWLYGSGDLVESQTIYSAWRRVFTQLLDLDLFDDPAARRRHVLLTLGAERLRLAPLLNEILQLNIPPTNLIKQMSPSARAENTRNLLQQLLQLSVNRSPKVVLIDDAHWMDSTSWALTLAISQSVRPLLLIVALRPTTTLPTDYAHLLKTSGVKYIKLEPLTLEDTLQLVRERLGVNNLPEPVITLIKERAEGQPFFSQELAYALRDSGFIRIEGQTCVLSPEAGDLREVNLPNTVQGAVTRRIDRLAASQQLTLKVASVVGRVFPFRVVRDIHPVESNRSRLVEDLNTLEALDLTPLESVEPELAYVFKHLITQEVAYNLMLFAQRRELHRAVAEWYESSQAANLVPFYSILAHHWGKAEVLEKSLHYYMEAGQQALRFGASFEARAFFELALLSISQSTDSKLPEARRYQAILNTQLSELHRRLGEHQVARKMLGESVTLAREFDLPDVLAEALMRLGRVESDVSQNDLAFQHLDEALTLSRQIDNRKLIADVLYNLSVLAMGKDEYHQAIARSNESSEIFRELGDQYGEAGCINIVGYAYWCLGDYVNSERYYLSALTLARQMVNPYMVAIVLDNLGFAQMALNKDSEAQKTFQESLAGTLDTHALTITLEVIVGIATLIMRAGDHAEAMTLLQFAVNHSAATVDVKRLAQPPLNQLLKLMPSAAVEAAIQRSHSLDFDSVVAKVTKV